ncbi:MAG: hypothetical protein HW413_971 [Thermoleophilia bacterium]|nr:hypothetical protein [Thermoleophilia bacterium]
MGDRGRRRDCVRARRDTNVLGVGMARGRPCSTRVLGLGQQVRGRAAPRRGHCARQRGRRACAREWGDQFRRTGSHQRPDRDDRHSRWSQGVPHPSRGTAREARRDRRGGRHDRRGWAVRRAGARRRVCPSRRSGRRWRHVRRPAVLASAARCHHPSAGTRGAARTNSRAHSGATTGRGSTARCAAVSC